MSHKYARTAFNILTTRNFPDAHLICSFRLIFFVVVCYLKGVERKAMLSTEDIHQQYHHHHNNSKLQASWENILPLSAGKALSSHWLCQWWDQSSRPRAPQHHRLTHTDICHGFIFILPQKPYLLSPYFNFMCLLVNEHTFCSSHHSVTQSIKCSRSESSKQGMKLCILSFRSVT